MPRDLPHALPEHHVNSIGSERFDLASVQSHTGRETPAGFCMCCVVWERGCKWHLNDGIKTGERCGSMRDQYIHPPPGPKFKIPTNLLNIVTISNISPFL